MIDTTHRVICPKCAGVEMTLDVGANGMYYTIRCRACLEIIAPRVGIFAMGEDHKDE